MRWACMACTNLFWCFAKALIVTHHTIKRISYFEEGVSQDLTFEVPFDPVTGSRFAGVAFVYVKWWAYREHNENNVRHEHASVPQMPGIYILLQASVVQFRIGNIIKPSTVTGQDNAAIFQLLDRWGNCVGEIITTNRTKAAAQGCTIDLICIS
jgi:hypothetical protein